MTKINCSVEEYMLGVDGDLSKAEIVDAIASKLCEYVYESFLDAGWHDLGGDGIVNEKLQRKVCRMIAHNLIDQWEHDEALWKELWRMK
jgi:hypothetical protein